MKLMDLAKKTAFFMVYYSIIAIPFFMAINQAPTNVFMGILLSGFLLKKLLDRESFFPRLSINLPLAIFFLLTCVSILHSVSIKDTLRGGILRLLEYILVLYAVYYSVQDKKHLSRIILSFCAGIILTCANEFWQVYSGKDFIRGTDVILNIGLLRATSSFGDANTLGIYLSALVPAVLGGAFFYHKGLKRVSLVIVSILGVLGIALTYSRPTLLAIYVVLWFFAIARKNKKLIIFLAVFTVLAPLMLPLSVKKWAKEVDYNPLRFMCNDDRVTIYKRSIEMIKDHPVIGFGANTYMKDYKGYKYTVPAYRGVETIDYIYAHNNFLHMAVEVGLAGLAVFLWFIFAVFKEAKSTFSCLKDDYLKVICLSLTACVIAFLVNGLTESSLYYARVALIFWYLCGLLLSLRRISCA